MYDERKPSVPHLPLPSFPFLQNKWRREILPLTDPGRWPKGEWPSQGAAALQEGWLGFRLWVVFQSHKPRRCTGASVLLDFGPPATLSPCHPLLRPVLLPLFLNAVILPDWDLEHSMLKCNFRASGILSWKTIFKVTTIFSLLPYGILRKGSRRGLLKSCMTFF